MKEIENNVIKWTQDYLGKDFKFRPYQKEIIVQIINDKINNNIYHHIIQAPTGSGKSLINIICAGVLWEYYEQKSYILCSDLYLYKQYEDFINKYNLQQFKYLKGATGNYYCSKNNSDVGQSMCRMAGLSYKELYNIMNSNNDNNKDKLAKIFNCAKTCKYLQERFDATNAPITLMTYDLFHFQMNICNIKYDLKNKPIIGQFLWRDNIFCDECHNIPNIMQSRCKAIIEYNYIKDLKYIFNYYKSLKKNKENIKIFNYIPNEQEIENRFKEYWTKMLDKNLTSYENTILLLNFFNNLIRPIRLISARIQSIFGTKVKRGLMLSDKEKEVYAKIRQFQNWYCFLSDYSHAIALSGFNYTYKQILKNSISFGTVKEDGIIYMFLLRHGIKGTTLLSATVGNKDAFIDNCGFKFFGDKYKDKISKLQDNLKDSMHQLTNYFPNNLTNENVKYINVPSNFDFSNSPIYIDNEYKVNIKNKKISLLNISQKINNILSIHYNENGIIQTGSYENAQYIYKYLNNEHKNRVLIYKNAKEKKQLISKINKYSNYILIGPSLIEGIDLPGKLCTFIIIAKVPYLSLGDKYVTSKMKIFKKWYNETTANHILQGIGRGNRYDKDWSSIYILDGAFKRLYSYTKQTYPKYITNRFIYTNINDLYKNEIKQAI